MVDRVRDALATSRIETTYAVVSPYAPETRAHVAGDLPLVETPGEGTSRISPVRSNASRCPSSPSPRTSRCWRARWDTVALERRRVDERARPRALKEALGASCDSEEPWVPTGLNVVDEDEDGVYRSYDARLAVNVNRRSDAELAERLLAAGR